MRYLDDDKLKGWRDVLYELELSHYTCKNPATMKYEGSDCASKALSIALGYDITCRGNGSAVDMLRTAAIENVTAEIVWEQPVEATRRYLFSHTSDPPTAIIIPLQGNDKTPPRKLRHVLDEYSVAMLALRQVKLYPDGHWIVLQKLNDVWYVSDPLLPAGACYEIPSRKLVMFLAGADIIIGIETQPKIRKSTT